MTEPNIGDRVRVWPKPGLRVQEHPSVFGRFIPDDGVEVEWSHWHHDRLFDGSLLLEDPRQKPSPKSPVFSE